jgi:hypothetical protein
MFKFVYEYLKPKWGDKVEIIQTDTDGLLLHIKTEDFYEDINLILISGLTLLTFQ